MKFPIQREWDQAFAILPPDPTLDDGACIVHLNDLPENETEVDIEWTGNPYVSPVRVRGARRYETRWAVVQPPLLEVLPSARSQEVG